MPRRSERFPHAYSDELAPSQVTSLSYFLDELSDVVYLSIFVLTRPIRDTFMVKFEFGFATFHGEVTEPGVSGR